MSSPESNEDPYLVLGVPKDADISTIRAAHRKLALKFHPDRIRDEAQRARGKDEFQKIQKAYEVLSDPAERLRYDDRIKLAQLRKEAMAREPPPPVRTPSYPTRSAMPTPTREYRDGKFYEERVPTASYFDEGHKYRDEETRTTSRKYDGYERRPSTGNPDKERKSSKWPEKTPSGLSFNIATKLKVKATKTRETVRVRESTKETYAASAKARDREQHRDRFEKQTSRSPYVEDMSDSDSDTATQFTAKPSRPVSASKPNYPPSPRPTTHRESSGKKTSSPRYVDEDDDGDDDKWHGYHENAAEYIQRSQARPPVTRVDSSPSYWGGFEERSSGRKSGSDSDRRPRSSKGRRPSIDVQKTRPPTMPSHNSAPSGVNGMRSQLDRKDRTPTRSASGGKSSREHQKEIPTMSRSQTMPSVKSSRKGDAAPIRGSNLKHAETHRDDSGYGSSGGHTPEMRGSSPPKYSSTTKYQIVEPDDDFGTPQLFFTSEERYRQSRSPSPPPREKDRRERPTRPTVTVESRPRQSRGATYSHSPVEMDSPRQGTFRHDSSRSAPRGDSPRDSPPISRNNSGRGTKLFGEFDDPYSYRMPPESVIMTPRFDKQKVKYAQYDRRTSVDDNDYYPSSYHREQIRQPRMERRGSVY